MASLLRSHRKKKEEKERRKSEREAFNRGIDEVRQTLETNLNDDALMQAHIKYLYNEMYVYILMKLSEKDVIDQLNSYSPDFMTSLKTTIENFDELECPIVVAGETSAGKSSILNLFLGERILPVSLVRATSTVCHICYGVKKSLTVINDDGSALKTDVHKNKHIKEEIEKHVLHQPGTSKKEVFIRWPVPFLKGRLTIVDTPGISEPEMAEKVRDILPRAAAFIYVVNTMNAGGVLLDGKLFELLKTHSTKQEHIDNMKAFDPQSAIFVLNKWDCVPQDEEKEVEDAVWENLQMCWPGLIKDQIYKLSAKQEEKGMSDVKKHSIQFKRLCYGIENLIPIGLKMNTKGQFTRLWNVLKYLERIVNMRLDTARKSREEKRVEVERLNRRATILIQDINTIVDDLRTMLTNKSNDIASLMFDYFRYPDVVAKLTKWDESDAPKLSNISDIEKEIKMLVRKRINSELEKFVVKSDFYNTILQDIYKILHEKLQLVDREIKQWENDINIVHEENTNGLLSSNTSKNKGEQRYMQTLGAVLGIVLDKGMPFLVSTNYVASLISTAVLAALELKQKIELNTYNKNRTSYMAQRTRDVLKEFDKSIIKENVVDKMMDNLWRTVTLVEKNIPRLIKADKNLINDMLTDLRDVEEIIHRYRQPKRFCRSFKAKLILFRIQYFGNCTVQDTDVQYIKQIGSGAYSNVYEATYKSSIKVAVKDFHANNHDSNEVYYQCLEVDMLMTLRHKNVVELFGVIFDDSRPNRQPKLKLIMELCDTCLWDMVTAGTDTKFIPSQQRKSVRQLADATKFYKKTVRQIIEGLAFIHSKGYVHRDLKLANILIKDGVAKISDVGLSAAEDEITGTACGTVSHMAPEVIERKPYGQPADIYSLGILMWELWYGVYSYENYSKDEVIRDVLTGYRPTFVEHERPPDKIQKLIKSCWHNKPSERPTADDCSKQLESTTSGFKLKSLIGL